MSAVNRPVEIAVPSPSGVAPARVPLAAIKLHQVRYALSAAEYGSFRRAAGALNIQQSTISRRVRELEDQLGAAIFERRASGVGLTPAGDRFIQDARRAVVQLEDAARQIGDVARAEQAVLRLGIVTPLASGFLDRLLRAAMARPAAPKLILTEGSPREHLAAIEAGQLDVAFLAGRVRSPNRGVSRLWREPIVLAMPRTHPLAAKDTILWSDLRGQGPVLVQAGAGPELLGWLERRLRPGAAVARQAVSRDTLARLVAMEQGLAVLLREDSETDTLGVAYRPILGAALRFSAVWAPRNTKTALRRFLALAGTMAGDSRS